MFRLSSNFVNVTIGWNTSWYGCGSGSGCGRFWLQVLQRQKTEIGDSLTWLAHKLGAAEHKQPEPAQDDGSTSSCCEIIFCSGLQTNLWHILFKQYTQHHLIRLMSSSRCVTTQLGQQPSNQNKQPKQPQLANCAPSRHKYTTCAARGTLPSNRPQLRQVSCTSSAGLPPPPQKRCNTW